jgi:hypothetical protein
MRGIWRRIAPHILFAIIIFLPRRKAVGKTLTKFGRTRSLTCVVLLVEIESSITSIFRLFFIRFCQGFTLSRVFPFKSIQTTKHPASITPFPLIPIGQKRMVVTPYTLVSTRILAMVESTVQSTAAALQVRI